MMSLLFLLITAAMFALLMGRTHISDARVLDIKISYVLYGSAFVLSLYWFSYHASEHLDIIL